MISLHLITEARLLRDDRLSLKWDVTIIDPDLQTDPDLQILVKKRALARNIYSVSQSTEPNNNFNWFPFITIQISCANQFFTVHRVTAGSIITTVHL